MTSYCALRAALTSTAPTTPHIPEGTQTKPLQTGQTETENTSVDDHETEPSQPTRILATQTVLKPSRRRKTPPTIPHTPVKPSHQNKLTHFYAPLTLQNVQDRPHNTTCTTIQNTLYNRKPNLPTTMATPPSNDITNTLARTKAICSTVSCVFQMHPRCPFTVEMFNAIMGFSSGLQQMDADENEQDIFNAKQAICTAMNICFDKVLTRTFTIEMLDAVMGYYSGDRQMNFVDIENGSWDATASPTTDQNTTKTTPNPTTQNANIGGTNNVKQEEIPEHINEDVIEGARVTPGTDQRKSTGDQQNRRKFPRYTQATLNSIPKLSPTSARPTTKTFTGIDDAALERYLIPKYPVMKMNGSLHCPVESNKQEAVKFIFGLLGLTTPTTALNALITIDGENNYTLPLIDLFEHSGLNLLGTVQDVMQWATVLHVRPTMSNVLRGVAGPLFGPDRIPIAHPILCAFRADGKGPINYVHRYVVYIPLINTIITPSNDCGRNHFIHAWCIGTNGHTALEQENIPNIDKLFGGKIFPGGDKLTNVTLLGAVVVQTNTTK